MFNNFSSLCRLGKYKDIIKNKTITNLSSKNKFKDNDLVLKYFNKLVLIKVIDNKLILNEDDLDIDNLKLKDIFNKLNGINSLNNKQFNQIYDEYQLVIDDFKNMMVETSNEIKYQLSNHLSNNIFVSANFDDINPYGIINVYVDNQLTLIINECSAEFVQNKTNYDLIYDNYVLADIISQNIIFIRMNYLKFTSKLIEYPA